MKVPSVVTGVAIVATVVGGVYSGGKAFKASLALIDQKNSLTSFQFDPDRFDCQKGKELPVKESSFWDLCLRPFKTPDQSFLCDDGTTITYNLPNDSKIITIPNKLLPNLGGRISGDTIDPVEVRSSISGVLQQAAKRLKSVK